MNRSDNFNRTASPPGTPSDGGSAWVVNSGSWGCGFDSTSGRTVLFDTAGGSAQLDCGVTDHSNQALLVRNDSGAGVTVRAQDDNNYYLLNVATDNTTSIFKKVSGTFTLLANGSASAPIGSTIFLSAVGSALVAQVNGSNIASTTDTALTTGTAGGCRNGPGGFGFYDDLAITDLSGGGGGGIIYTQLERNTRGLNRGSYFFQG